jgi:hypothetical protein
MLSSGAFVEVSARRCELGGAHSYSSCVIHNTTRLRMLPPTRVWRRGGSGQVRRPETVQQPDEDQLATQNNLAPAGAHCGLQEGEGWDKC